MGGGGSGWMFVSGSTPLKSNYVICIQRFISCNGGLYLFFSVALQILKQIFLPAMF